MPRGKERGRGSAHVELGTELDPYYPWECSLPGGKWLRRVAGQTMGSLRAAAVAPPAFAFDSVQAHYLQAPIKHHPSAQGPGREGASEGSWGCQGQCPQSPSLSLCRPLLLLLPPHLLPLESKVEPKRFCLCGSRGQGWAQCGEFSSLETGFILAPGRTF